MSTKNAVKVMADRIARRIVAEQTRARIMLSFDAAIIAAHEVFHMGPGRAGAFANAYNEAMEELAGLYVDDCEQNGDKGFLMKEIRRMDRWAKTYTEHENKMIKIGTYLRKHWPHIRFLTGTDPEYIDQILDYNPSAAHDDAPDSAACVCRLLDSGTGWGCRWT